MKSPVLVKETRSRTLFVVFGLLVAFAGVLALLAVPLVVGLDPAVALLVAGHGVAMLLFGILCTVSTPATGTPGRKVRLYKLQLAIVTLVPLAATLPVLASPYRALVGFAAIPVGVLYLALQVDWDDARRHLERIREDPDSVQFVPPEALTLTRHVMAGTGSVLVGFLLPGVVGILYSGLAAPLEAAVVLAGLAFVVAGVATAAATPHRGPVERTVLALRVLVVGPGACLLLAGLAWFAGGGSVVVASLSSLVGAALLYLGLGRISWRTVGRIVEEMRTADEVTWARAPEAIETVSRRDDDVRESSG